MTVELESSGLDRPESGEDESLVGLDDAVDGVVRPGHRGYQGFTFGNPLLAERYLKRKLNLAVEFTTDLSAFGRGHSEQYRVVFKREHRINGVRNPGDADLGPGYIRRIMPELINEEGREVGTDDKVGSVAVVRGPYRNNQVVLVDDIESVEPPQRSTSSLVWLERPQYADGPFVGSTYFSNVAGYKFLLGIADREARRPGWPSTSVDDELFGQMVETRPQVMEDVTYKNRPHEGDLLSDADAADQIACFRIILTNNAVWVGVLERPDFAIEVTEVLFGPTDL